MAKVEFDGLNKLIIVNTGVTSIDVETELYSAWKDWVYAGNSMWSAAFRTVGGDVIGTNQTIPKYFFLINNWRVQVDNLSVNFATNLYSDDYDNPLIITNSSVYIKNSDVPGSSQLSSITYTVGIINTSLTTMEANIKSILGLSQQNYRLSGHVYDSNDKLTFCNIKLYNNSSDCNNDVNEFETYQMNATYDISGNLTDYKVIKL